MTYSLSNTSTDFDLTSTKDSDSEQNKFNNLLQMMSEDLFNKDKNYYIKQFSENTITNGLNQLTSNKSAYLATFNTIMSALKNLPQKEFDNLPECIQEWYTKQ